MLRKYFTTFWRNSARGAFECVHRVRRKLKFVSCQAPLVNHVAEGFFFLFLIYLYFWEIPISTCWLVTIYTLVLVCFAAYQPPSSSLLSGLLKLAYFHCRILCLFFLLLLLIDLHYVKFKQPCLFVLKFPELYHQQCVLASVVLSDQKKLIKYMFSKLESSWGWLC